MYDVKSIYSNIISRTLKIDMNSIILSTKNSLTPSNFVEEIL